MSDVRIMKKIIHLLWGGRILSWIQKAVSLWEVRLRGKIPLLGLYPKNPETPIQKNLCTPMFIAAQFTIAKCWKQPKRPSVNEWIKKLWCIYTVEYYAAGRKKEHLPFATALRELVNIMLSEISQFVKDKYHRI